jgi:hypothetical protein
MSPDELAYFRERAFIERRRASDSTIRLAADIHLKLACLYERIVELEEHHAPTFRVVNIGHPAQSDTVLSSVPELDGSLDLAGR